MTDVMQDDQGLSVVVDRDIPHAPDKIWRALTQSHLIGEWLMKTDFQPEVGHPFTFKAEWGNVTCKVIAVEPNRLLSYTWSSYGLDSTVTWTLTPTATGTRLQMEQKGFRADFPQAYQGAQQGWPRFLQALEALLARLS